MDTTLNSTSNRRLVLGITSETDESASAARAETITSVNGRKVFQPSSHELPVTPRSATTTNSDAVSLGHRNVSGRAALAFGALTLSSFFMTALSAPTTRATPTAPTFSSALSNATSSALSMVSPDQKIEILRKGLEQVKEEVAKLQVDMEAVQSSASRHLTAIRRLYTCLEHTDPVPIIALVFAALCLVCILLKPYKN